MLFVGLVDSKQLEVCMDIMAPKFRYLQSYILIIKKSLSTYPCVRINIESSHAILVYDNSSHSCIVHLHASTTSHSFISSQTKPVG